MPELIQIFISEYISQLRDKKRRYEGYALLQLRITPEYIPYSLAEVLICNDIDFNNI